jgi:hypothetical protein
MPIDRERVQRWLDDYVRAWETYDETAIAALFSEDAVYRWHPWDEGDDVARGRVEIVAAWVDEDDRDPAGTYDGRYEPVAVDGNVVVARGISRYYTDATRATLDREYHNVFLMEFDDAGRCRSFTELFLKTPPDRAG